MNTKQKAKAYDEALDKAKEMIKALTNVGGVVKADDIQYLFPELKESEDERIRKVLINCFSGLPDSETYRGVPPSKIIAWLEKQKPAEWSEEDERLRQSCINHIDDELERVRNDKYGHSGIISALKESCRERIKWLESLHPEE